MKVSKLFYLLIPLLFICVSSVYASSEIPHIINYQGYIKSSGSPYNGTGYFKFAVIDSNSSPTTSYWSNDGSSIEGSVPTAAVSATVSNGVFNIALGNTSLTNMNTISTSVFASYPTTYLRVWFSEDNSTFTQLTSGRRLVSVPYAYAVEIDDDGGLEYGSSGLKIANDRYLSGTTYNTMLGEGVAGAGNLSHTTGLTGYANTLIGYYSGYNITTGYYNTASGMSALYYNTSGYMNTAYGGDALTSNTTGNYNTACGTGALALNVTGNNNTAMGYGALDAVDAESDCTAVGYDALTANTTGADATAVGSGALDANTTGNYNTAIGKDALGANMDGTRNTASGYKALYSNTSGASNTANGYYTLYSNTTGTNNTATGYNALLNSTGNDNTALGYNALTANTSAAGSTAVGSGALAANTTGAGNTAIGYNALTLMTTTSYNTAVGYGALDACIATGANNTAVGYNALGAVTNGSSNTAIGRIAGSNITTGSSNIIIGAGESAPDGEASNQLNIGGTIYGDLSTDYISLGDDTSPESNLEIDTTATVGVQAVTIDQDDADKAFIDFQGTSSADAANNISTMNGDGSVEGPKNYSSSNGWQYEGMIQIEINGVAYWMPYYSVDTD